MLSLRLSLSTAVFLFSFLCYNYLAVKFLLFMSNLSSSKKGFTLVELLIVIFIMVLLAALVLAATQGARQRSRDGRRKADVDQIKKAMELYRSDNGGNVPDASCTAASPCLSSTAGSWIAGLAPTYIPAVLKDPSNNGSYVYRFGNNRAAGGTDFEIDAAFEDASNDSLENNTNDNGTCAARYETGTNPQLITAACL